MATFAQRFNSGNSIFADIDCKDFPFVKLAELHKEAPEAVHHVDGFYFHQGQFGEECVIIDAHAAKRVNAPAHMNNAFKQVVEDETAIADIRAGKVGFKVRTYIDSKKIQRCSITFVDLAPAAQQA